LFQKSATKTPAVFAARNRELPKNRGWPWRRLAARELASSNRVERRGIIYSIYRLGDWSWRCPPRMAMLCREGQVRGASAMAGLAAALVTKGAAETMEGVCRKSIMCERIGDARHRPCAEASSVPLDYLAQAQDTLRYEGIDEC
jgi:hypothetical protein